MASFGARDRALRKAPQRLAQAVEALGIEHDIKVYPDDLVATRFQDVVAVYATRSKLISNYPPHALFDCVTSIRACGLSLNLICSSTAVPQYRPAENVVSLMSMIRAAGPCPAAARSAALA